MADKMQQNSLIIATLFPSILNTNGDSANARVLAQRARWAGISDVQLVEVEHADQMPDDADLVVVGACGDPDLVRARNLLLTVEHALRSAVASSVPVLAVDTGWYLLSQSFLVPGRASEPGLGLFSGSATQREQRISDDLVVNSVHGQLVGYENHSGGYSLGHDEESLGAVVYGSGNGSGTEGAVSGPLIGTHLRGPVLARNPGLADHLLARALGRTGGALPKPSERTQVADQYAANARAAVTTTLGV